MDESSNSAGLGVGLLLIDPKGFTTEYALWFEFSATNNESKYEALIIGLKIIKKLGVQKLRICSDSQLEVGQVKGDFEMREENMKRYL